MNTHRTLVRSSVLVALAGVAMPLGIANAETTLYATQGSFESAAGAGGLAQRYMETFEEHAPVVGYDFLGPVLTTGVANSSFEAGLDAPELTVRASFGSLFALVPEGGYWPNVTSTVVGTNSESDKTILEFAGDGAMAVGMTITGVNTFTTNYPEEVQYEIRDLAGVLIATGTWATPTSETGSFFGVHSTEAMGSIELRGLRFGLDTQEYVDNLQTWIDDGPDPVPGDANGDGVVNVDDVVAVVLAWGDCPGCPEDLNGDDVVDIDDIVEVVLNFS